MLGALVLLLASPCYYLPLRQCHHAAPELRELPSVDVVLAHKGERAVAADAIHAQGGGERSDRIAVAYGHGLDARRHQQAPACIDAEGTQMDRVRLAILQQRRLPSGLVYGEHGHVVLAAIRDLLPVEVDD